MVVQHQRVRLRESLALLRLGASDLSVEVLLHHWVLAAAEVGLVEAAPVLLQLLLYCPWLAHGDWLRPLVVHLGRGPSLAVLVSHSDVLPLRLERLLLVNRRHGLSDLLLWRYPLARALPPHLLHEPLLVPQERLDLEHLLGCDVVELSCCVAALVRRLRLIQRITELRHRALVTLIIHAELALVQGIAYDGSIRCMLESVALRVVPLVRLLQILDELRVLAHPVGPGLELCCLSIWLHPHHLSHIDRYAAMVLVLQVHLRKLQLTLTEVMGVSGQQVGRELGVEAHVVLVARHPSAEVVKEDLRGLHHRLVVAVTVLHLLLLLQKLLVYGVLLLLVGHLAPLVECLELMLIYWPRYRRTCFSLLVLVLALVLRARQHLWTIVHIVTDLDRPVALLLAALPICEVVVQECHLLELVAATLLTLEAVEGACAHVVMV